MDEDEVRELVKVHYEGYSTSYDEWRAKDDIVDLHSGDQTGHGDGDTFGENTPEAGSLICLFNLYRELVVGIKASLTSGQKEKPPNQSKNHRHSYLYGHGRTTFWA